MSDKHKSKHKSGLPSIEVPSADSLVESLLTFPTDFSIKAIGKYTPAFKQAVLDIIERTIASKDLLNITEQFSANKHYLSLTIMATFNDQASIDKVYQALTAEPLVIMAL